MPKDRLNKKTVLKKYKSKFQCGDILQSKETFACYMVMSVTLTDHSPGGQRLDHKVSDYELQVIGGGDGTPLCFDSDCRVVDYGRHEDALSEDNLVLVLRTNVSERRLKHMTF
jgi:hypothetical protein